MWDLGGKAALVTGGSRGLGKAFVVELARANADVAYCYQKDAQAAEAVASVVVFLATDAAWAVTGQTSNVDCGLVKL